MFTPDPAGVLARGRALAARLRVDRCTVHDPGADVRQLDPTTLRYQLTRAAPLYDGPCEVKQQQGAQFDRPAAEQTTTLVSYVVKLPIEVVDVAEGHVVTVTASASDPGLVDLVLVVRSVNRGTRLTSRRLVCTEFT